MEKYDESGGLTCGRPPEWRSTLLVSETFDENDGDVVKILTTCGINSQKSLDIAQAYLVAASSLIGSDQTSRTEKSTRAL
ncbi:hypothetical protein [Tateyamaria sp.]|uniref:hypothetical protein n=1 Tax=Tateyamaria sp. TaxID=1929288 RepID=UPI00328E59B1